MPDYFRRRIERKKQTKQWRTSRWGQPDPGWAMNINVPALIAICRVGAFNQSFSSSGPDFSGRFDQFCADRQVTPLTCFSKV
jgi:hypothetical protein